MPPEASARRGGYGGERYEKLAFQQVVGAERCRATPGSRCGATPLSRLHMLFLRVAPQVAGMFERLKDASWRSFDAEQAIDDIHQQVSAGWGAR